MLVAAYQKFYNALSSIERFEKDSDLFDNIRSIDQFLTEFRSTYFVAYSELSVSPYFAQFDTLSKEYIPKEVYHNLKEMRNNEIHQHPTDLTKKVIITVFTGEDVFNYESKTYNFTDEEGIDRINNSIKNDLLALNLPDVAFSVEYIFEDAKTGYNIFDNVLPAVKGMKEILLKMSEHIDQDDASVTKLKEKIDSLKFLHKPVEFILVDDYIYNVESDTFERGGRTLSFFPEQTNKKIYDNPISYIKKDDLLKYTDLNTPLQLEFFKFMIINLSFFEKSKDSLANYYVIYDDNSFSSLRFTGSLKTTFFRKEYEVAKEIYSKNVKAVFFMSVINIFNHKEKVQMMKSTERMSIEDKADGITFYYSDKNGVNKQYTFTTDGMENRGYVKRILKKSVLQPFIKNSPSMHMVRKAFREKYHIS